MVFFFTTQHKSLRKPNSSTSLNLNYIYVYIQTPTCIIITPIQRQHASHDICQYVLCAIQLLHQLHLEECANWLKILFDEEISQIIHRYDPQDFNNFTDIGSGGSASVHTADWKDTENTTKFIIKKLIKSSMKEAINKVRYQYTVVLFILFKPFRVKLAFNFHLRSHLDNGN